MQLDSLSTDRKAQIVNLDDLRYGTFAEIGAGQEVARHFFQVGLASHTVAKTMSAYDMVFSNSIYGKEASGRYVCESRLMKMLTKEYSLLNTRLAKIRGDKTTFFSFANTVATADRGKKQNIEAHGWMGVRFQTKPNGEANDIVLHVRMLNRSRLLQQEALGILGVNLIFAAFYTIDKPQQLIKSLIDNIGADRIEIDMIRFTGPDLQHIDNRLMSLDLVRNELTNAVLFGSDGNVQQASDALYKKTVFIQRGTFRPITKTNVDILELGLQQFLKRRNLENPLVIIEITMTNLQTTANLDQKDFLERVDTLCALGYTVLISNYTLFYQLKSYLRRYTKSPIGMVIGAAHLEKLFEEKYYAHLEGGILEAFGKFLNDDTTVYVYPYQENEKSLNTKSFQPAKNLQKFYEYLIENEKFIDLKTTNLVSIHSEDVRKMLENNDPKWEKLVPAQVTSLIKKKKLFGYQD